MFSRAVQGQQPPSTAASQKPSSQKYGISSQPLYEKPASVLNSIRPAGSTKHNPLKRTSSEISGRSSTGSPGSVGKRVRTPTSMQPMQTSRLVNLHANVFFDENDFEDDSNIDLDEDVDVQASLPVIKAAPVRPPAMGNETQDPLPTPRPMAAPQTPASSTQPFAWSSSPSTHYLAANLQLPLPSPKPTSDSKAAARRSLPWLEGQSLVKPQRDPEHKQARNYATQSGSRPLDSKANGTPPAANPTSSPYPWKLSASAVKQEHKKMRQGNKRQIMENKNNAENTGLIKKKRRDTIPRVFLSEEQKQVLDLVADQKRSVFFTGSAGTGKSVLLREIIKNLRDRFKREQDRIAVTASTGLAACNVGGVTLHSFAGIGLGKEDVPTLVRKIKKNQKAKSRWQRTKVLIVDEISMVDGDLFDKLEGIARAIRNNGRPFGGIQLVITGDFFQLPPVPDYGRQAKFAFDAATWNTSIEHTIGLTQVFRQKDPVFANMLNEMRLGRLTQKSIDAFKTLNRPLGFQDDFEATELFPTRNEVDGANHTRMRNLTGQELEYKAIDAGTITDISQREKLLANCMAPQIIKLKKGAQVMLIKNIDETLVNGSVGKVVAFMDERTFEIYHEDEDEFQAGNDDEEMSRSRSKLKDLLAKKEKNASVTSTALRWPLVRFAIADGSSRDLLCQAESWKIELPNGEIQASRSQVPLILAWALSIHKAQGQTLDRVKVDLGKIFEKGQAYVALSRATCQEGLQIMRFDPKKVMAHDRVRTFYDGLYSASHASASTNTTTTAVSGLPAVDSTSVRKKPGAQDHESTYMRRQVGRATPQIHDLTNDNTNDDEEAELAAMYG